MKSSLLYAVFIITLVIFSPGSTSLPFAVIHGFGQKCADHKVAQLTEHLSNWSGTKGHCLDSGHGTVKSLLLPLQDQAEIVCDKVKQMKELERGYNIVGLSQGSLIARGVIEFCDGAPPVKNFISLAAPNAGTASTPYCLIRIICFTAASIINLGIYRDFIQAHFAAAGYFKAPNNIPAYLEKSKFLPKLNNEISHGRNSTYKERFSSLEKLVLITFEHDKVLIPKETSRFGYYPDGAFSRVLPPQQTKLYVENWMGLKALDDADKVKYVSVAGSHLEISRDDINKHIVPYLKTHDSRWEPMHQKRIVLDIVLKESGAVVSNTT